MSVWIADKITKTEDEYYRSYYEYSIEGLISTAIYITISIVLALIFGYFPQIIVIIALFLAYRAKSGGSHAITPLICGITTCSVYLLCGLATLLNGHMYLIFFGISLTSLIGMKYIPRYTEKAKQHSVENQELFRFQYKRLIYCSIVINVFLIILTILGWYNFSSYIIAVSTAMIANRILLSNLAFKMLKG